MLLLLGAMEVLVLKGEAERRRRRQISKELALPVAVEQWLASGLLASKAVAVVMFLSMMPGRELASEHPFSMKTVGPISKPTLELPLFRSLVPSIVAPSIPTAKDCHMI